MSAAPKPAGGKGEKSAKNLLKDKRVQIGLAAAGGLGLVVLLKKGNGNQQNDPNQTGQALQPSTFDSSSTDAYAQLSQGLGDQISQFGSQLTDIQTQLGKLNGPSAGGTTTGGTTTGGTSGGTTSGGSKSGGGSTKRPPGPTPQYVYASKFTTASAARGSNWASTLSTIADHYHTSVSNLLKLNPSIHNPNLIQNHQKIRVK